jgi:hypothetical protein
LRDALATALVPVPDHALACGWTSRARALRVLEEIDPIEAEHLRRAPASDVRLWTVLHAADTCRVSDHGRRGPVPAAAEREMLGFIYCGAKYCIDEDDHEWDERECRDQETGEWRDDTTCVGAGRLTTST